MIYYAIRQKSTGYMMPNYGTRRGLGGFTNDEPTRLNVAPPRLFLQAHFAERALKAWLKVVHSVTTSVSYSGLGDEDVSEDWKIEPKDRNADDMEIVKVELL